MHRPRSFGITADICCIPVPHVLPPYSSSRRIRTSRSPACTSQYRIHSKLREPSRKGSQEPFDGENPYFMCTRTKMSMMQVGVNEHNHSNRYGHTANHKVLFLLLLGFFSAPKSKPTQLKKASIAITNQRHHRSSRKSNEVDRRILSLQITMSSFVDLRLLSPIFRWPRYFLREVLFCFVDS